MFSRKKSVSDPIELDGLFWAKSLHENNFKPCEKKSDNQHLLMAQQRLKNFQQSIVTLSQSKIMRIMQLTDNPFERCTQAFNELFSALLAIEIDPDINTDELSNFQKTLISTIEQFETWYQAVLSNSSFLAETKLEQALSVPEHRHHGHAALYHVLMHSLDRIWRETVTLNHESWQQTRMGFASEILDFSATYPALIQFQNTLDYHNAQVVIFNLAGYIHKSVPSPLPRPQALMEPLFRNIVLGLKMAGVPEQARETPVFLVQLPHIYDQKLNETKTKNQDQLLFNIEITARFTSVLRDIKTVSQNNEIEIYYDHNSAMLPVYVAKSLKKVLDRALMPVKDVFAKIKGKDMLDEWQDLLSNLEIVATDSNNGDRNGYALLRKMVHDCFLIENLSKGAACYLSGISDKTIKNQAALDKMRRFIFSKEEYENIVFYGRNTAINDLAILRYNFEILQYHAIPLLLKIEADISKKSLAHFCALLFPDVNANQNRQAIYSILSKQTDLDERLQCFFKHLFKQPLSVCRLFFSELAQSAFVNLFPDFPKDYMLNLPIYAPAEMQMAANVLRLKGAKQGMRLLAVPNSKLLEISADTYIRAQLMRHLYQTSSPSAETNINIALQFLPWHKIARIWFITKLCEFKGETADELMAYLKAEWNIDLTTKQTPFVSRHRLSHDAFNTAAICLIQVCKQARLNQIDKMQLFEILNTNKLQSQFISYEQERNYSQQIKTHFDRFVQAFYAHLDEFSTQHELTHEMRESLQLHFLHIVFESKNETTHSDLFKRLYLDIFQLRFAAQEYFQRVFFGQLLSRLSFSPPCLPLTFVDETAEHLIFARTIANELSQISSLPNAMERAHHLSSIEKKLLGTGVYEPLCWRLYLNIQNQEKDKSKLISELESLERAFEQAPTFIAFSALLNRQKQFVTPVYVQFGQDATVAQAYEHLLETSKRIYAQIN